MTNIQKKVALVTGASSGMGKEIAKQLLKDGLEVYVAARRLERMDDLKDLGAHPLKMDITKENNVQNVVSTIEKNHGGVDVLVNNAGFGSYGAVEDFPIEDARYQFEVNLFGLASLTQKVLPSMRAKKAGTIINISSIGGKIYSPLGAWYHATKHALEGWSDCLRLEVSQFGIDVIIVEPGAIRTEFGDVLVGPMVERSGKGPYAPLVQRLLNMTKEEFEKGNASPPQIIADVVSKGIKSNKPKTRYAAGRYSFITLFMRRWLSDRGFDRAIMSMLK